MDSQGKVDDSRAEEAARARRHQAEAPAVHVCLPPLMKREGRGTSLSKMPIFASQVPPADHDAT